MRQIARQTSKAIFRQLSDAPGGAGVKTVIENHDAWVHAEGVEAEITAAIRMGAARLPRSVETAQRIARQRQSLAPLVTRLPVRLSHAG